jgi:hypothetical protein
LNRHASIRFARRCAPFALVFALAACGGDGDDARQRAAQEAGEGLPTPAGAGGVTGTPEIGPGSQGQAPVLGGAPAVVSPDEDLVIDPAAALTNPETGLGADPDGDGPLTAPPAPDAGAAQPTAADAVGLVRDYYAAINARDYASAHRLWADNGAASGQSTLQFAGGFEATQGVSVEVGGPGAEDAGAGQRFIEVPVTVAATQADGSVKRFAGRYVLHRSVVDGATGEQRAWRIRSADLREVGP